MSWSWFGLAAPPTGRNVTVRWPAGMVTGEDMVPIPSPLITTPPSTKTSSAAVLSAAWTTRKDPVSEAGPVPSLFPLQETTASTAPINPPTLAVPRMTFLPLCCLSPRETGATSDGAPWLGDVVSIRWERPLSVTSMSSVPSDRRVSAAQIVPNATGSAAFLSQVQLLALLRRDPSESTPGDSVYRLERMSSQKIRPWVMSSAGTTTVGMKNAAPSSLASS